jgi:hypothetical protein
MLFHFDIQSFVYADQSAALTLDYTALMYAVILDYTGLPAAEDTAFPDL